MWKFKLSEYAIIIIALILAGTVAYGIFFEVIGNDFVSVSDIAIAAFALAFAVKTYFSIDGVGKIASMDGNLLENEAYTCPLGKLITENDADNQSEIACKIERRLSKDSKKANSALKVADFLQDFIDILILFPVLDGMQKQDGEKEPQTSLLKGKIEKIISDTEKKVEGFRSVSGGNIILLTETVKLLKEVFVFQQSNNKTKNGIFAIRGGVLKNPVSKIVYHDYLGLEYYVKGIKKLKHEKTQDLDECLNFVALHNVYEAALSLKENGEKADLDLAIEYFENAKTEFKHALELSKADLLWLGFLSFNAARAQFILFLLGGSEDDGISEFDACLKHRTLLAGMVEDLSNEESVLSDYFWYELDLAICYTESVKLLLSKENNDDTNVRVPKLNCKGEGYQARLESFLEGLDPRGISK